MESEKRLICPSCGKYTQVYEWFSGVDVYNKVQDVTKEGKLVLGDADIIDVNRAESYGFHCSSCMEYITNNPDELVLLYKEAEKLEQILKEANSG